MLSAATSSWSLSMPLAIDIGIENMGISWTSFDDTFPAVDLQLTEIKDFIVEDLTKPHHKRVPFEACKLLHTNTVSDRIDHLIQEYQDVFDKATRIFIEQQPPRGQQALEQLLFKRFRDKARLVY